MAIYGFVIDQLPTVDQIVVTNDDTIVNATALEQVSMHHKTINFRKKKILEKA